MSTNKQARQQSEKRMASSTSEAPSERKQSTRHNQRTATIDQQRQNMWRRRRQQMLAHLPPRVIASIMLAESAANLASTFNSKFLPTREIDRYFSGWTTQLIAYQAPPAAVIRHATKDALQLQAQAMSVTKRQPPRRSARRKHTATRKPTQPDMSMLYTTNEQDVKQWREKLANFIQQVRRHRQQSNPHYTIQLARWVSKPVWMHIAQRLLPRNQKTGRGQPTNDEAVSRYLLGLQAQTATPAMQTAQSTALKPSNWIKSSIQAAVQDGIIALREQLPPTQEPSMRVLASTEPGDIARWQNELQTLMADANAYRRRYDPNYQVNIRQWVRTDVWTHIASNLLPQRYRSTEGAPADGAAVEAFLLRRMGRPAAKST